ncbi:MAG: hypothetical protein DHS20C02_01270 [Micavibrio sp.]|nr:MAG: hypothetical protein DHS20C02_01270 [Micavibrio sp.]
MIEAVNSVISNAPVIRASAEQVNSVRAELPESVSVGPQAPFVSPYISVDVNFDTAVLQIRDSDTGDVVRQFPSESTLTARRRAAATTEAATASSSSSESTVIQAQESSSGGSEIAVNAPQPTTTAQTTAPSTPSAPPAAQAQVAAQALSAGAQTGESSSGNVSVVA